MPRNSSLYGSSMARDGDARQILTRRRGACESCKNRKVRCDGVTPCDQCHRLGRECIYKQNRRTHSSHSDAGPSREPVSEQRANSIDLAPSIPAHTGSLTSQESTTVDQEYAWNPPDSMTDMSWDLLSNQGNSLDDISTDVLPSNSTNLATTHDNGIPDIFASTVVFDGTSVEASSLLTTPISSFFSSELVGSSLESPDTFDIQSQSLPLNNNAFHKSKNPTLAPTSNPRRPQVSTTQRPVSAPSSRFSVWSAFTLAQCDGSNLPAEWLEKASTSFLGLEPAQHELVYAADADLNDSTLPSYSPVILAELIDACFEDLTGLGLFMRQDHLKRMLPSALENKSSSAPEKALVYSAIAIGAHLRNVDQGQKGDSSGIFFQLSLRMLSDVLLARDSLLKLQESLTVMMIYAKAFGLRYFSTLMTNAVWCAESLHLCQETGVTALSVDFMEQTWARRTFWYLYTLAQPFCLRWGLPFLLDEKRIDIDVPSNPNITSPHATDSIDYLQLQTQYAKLCSLIPKALYSHGALSRPPSTVETASELLHQQLDAWVSQIPTALWGSGIPPRERGHERRLYLQLRAQYYDALVAIDSCWLYLQSTFTDVVDQQRSEAGKRCLCTAKLILESYDSVHIADMLADRTLIVPPLVAVRIIFLAVILKWSDSSDISYLAIACGILGKLSVGFVVPLAEVMKLSTIAQQLCPAQVLSDKPSLI